PAIGLSDFLVRCTKFCNASTCWRPRRRTDALNPWLASGAFCVGYFIFTTTEIIATTHRVAFGSLARKWRLSEHYLLGPPFEKSRVLSAMKFCQLAIN